MAILTIDELIEQKERLDERKQRLYEINTPAGTLLCKQPTAATISAADKIKDTTASNAFLIMECVVEPNLKDAKLQKAFNAFEPMDVVSRIFKQGEIIRIVDQLLEISGYKAEVTHKIHEEIKN